MGLLDEPAAPRSSLTVNDRPDEGNDAPGFATAGLGVDELSLWMGAYACAHYPLDFLSPAAVVANTMSAHAAEASALAARIAATYLPESPFVITPIKGRGSVNQVFLVAARAAQVVVRMNDEAGTFEQYRKEAWCIAQAAARGVPGPKVLTVGSAARYAYMVQTFVAGANGADEHGATERIWYSLGEYARLIHALEVRGLGLTLTEFTQGDARTDWLRYVDYNIASLTAADELIKLGVLTWPEAQTVRQLFIELREREFKFGLNHGDLSLKNTVSAASGAITLLDWGSARADIVPHADLIQLLRMQLLENEPAAASLRAFLAGYGLTPAEFARMRPELDGLLLLRACDTLRWAIERRPERSADLAAQAKLIVAHTLRRV